MVGKTAVEDSVEAVRFVEIALLGIGRFSLVEAHEVVDLSEERADAAHLPHQPFDHLPARLLRGRHELARLFSQIKQYGARFHHRGAGAVIDNGGDLVVGADF